jgi:hypothetical protein
LRAVHSGRGVARNAIFSIPIAYHTCLHFPVGQAVPPARSDFFILYSSFCLPQASRGSSITPVSGQLPASAAPGAIE